MWAKVKRRINSQASQKICDHCELKYNSSSCFYSNNITIVYKNCLYINENRQIYNVDKIIIR